MPNDSTPPKVGKPKWIPFVTKALANPTPEQIRDIAVTRNREAIIGSLIRLTMHLSAIHAKKHPTKSDDIAGVALLTLVNSVDEYLALSPNEIDGNIAGYISYRINKAVVKYVIEDQTIRIPRSTIRDNVRRGTLDSLNHSVDTGVDITRLVEYGPMATERVDIWINTTPDLEVRDLLASLIHSDLDGQIMALRIEGHSDAEIGEMINLAPTTVRDHRLVIQRNLRLALGTD